MSDLIKGKALVIHIGDDETRVACLELGAKNPRILDSVVFPTPKGAVEDGVIRRADELRGQLAVLLETNPIFQKARRAVFVLQSTQVLTQSASVPSIKGRKQIEQLVRTNLDLYFPVDAAGYQITWQIVGHTHSDGIPKTRIQLWATPKSLLEQYYRLANGCGLTVAAVDYCGHSFAGGIHASFAECKAEQNSATTQKTASEDDRPPEREAASLYVHLEKSHVLMSFVRDKQVLQQRLFRRSNYLDTDLNEMFLEMEYFHTMFPGCAPGEYVVSGSELADGALMRGLEELAAGPLRRLHCEPDQIWCMVLGAAVTELDFGAPGMNTRGAVGKKLGSRWQYAVLAIGGAALLAAMLLFMHDSRTWNAELASLRLQQSELMLQLEESNIAGEKCREYDALYEAYRADWEKVFASTRTYNNNLCLLLEELESVLPRSAVVTHMGIGEQRLVLETAFQSKKDVAYFLVALRNLQYAVPNEISDLTRLEQQTAKPTQPTQPATGSDDISALIEKLEQLMNNASVEVNATSNQLPTGKELEALLRKYDMTEERLKEGLCYLTAAELAVLDKHYGNLYEEYTLRALLKSNATLTQRKNAIRSLLENDALAMHQFFLLMQEDGTRAGKDNVLTDLIRDDLWADPDMRGIVYDSDQKLPDELLSELIDILVKSRQTVTAAEELIRTHYNLTRKLAGHLASAMGKTSTYISGMDFAALQRDMLSGKTRQDGELDAVVRKMLSATALEYYNNLQSNAAGKGPSVPESTLAELLEQLPDSNVGSGDRNVKPKELPGNFLITVALDYKEELLLAGQARKGLDKDAMVQKVEVAE